ncbi:MAG: hypothetical protein Q8L54_01260 [Devosia sp.]|nr:hypothetical protein [Devosia sp.]
MRILRPLALLVIAIFVGELAIMFVLNYIPIAHGPTENFVDAALLILVVFPILYCFAFRTSMVAQERLEAQIKERTKDIEEVNRALERSVKQLDLHQQEMVLLGETGNLFQACHDLDEAVVVAEMQLRRLFPDLSVALFLMNPSRNTLQKVAGWGQGCSTLSTVRCMIG